MRLMPLSDWTWDDCNAEPVTWIMQQYLREPTGTVEQCDETACYEMPIYSEPRFVFGELWDEPPYPQANVLVPPAGSVIFLDVQAMDAAGNVSGGACP